MATWIISLTSNSNVGSERRVEGTLGDAKLAAEDRWGDTFRGDTMQVYTEDYALVADKVIGTSRWTHY